MTEQEFIPSSTGEIESYSVFEAQLVALEHENEIVVFDYATTGGEKSARSHIAKLRKTKKPIDDTRKQLKAQALEFGRQVDAGAKLLTARVEAMIEVHQGPLDEKAQVEQDRIDAIKAAMREIEECGRDAVKVGEFKLALAKLEKLQPDETFDELMADATALCKSTRETLERKLAEAIYHRDQARENELLREENAKHKAAEHYRQVAEEATADATAELEQREQAVTEREEAAPAPYAKKPADTDRQKQVNCAAAAAFMKQCPITEHASLAIVRAIVKGKIPGVTITY